MSDKVVYSVGDYEVRVGLPPVTAAEPFPIPMYLVVNKNTGVTENMHNILYNAFKAADSLNTAMQEYNNKKQEIAPTQGSLFN